MENNQNAPRGKVVSLIEFKQKKAFDESHAKGRSTPLYVSHAKGKMTGSPHLRGNDGAGDRAPDLNEKIQRIRMSLQRINSLMADLKSLAQVEGTKIPGEQK